MNQEEKSVPVQNDEERALLDAYARASAPSSSDVERALTRTLARLEGAERAASLPDRRPRFVWVAAAGLATLAIASAAVAGVRWYRAEAQPQSDAYGAAQFERTDDRVGDRVGDHVAATPVHVEPVPEAAPPASEHGDTPLDEASTIHAPPAPREPSPRRRARDKPAPSESTASNDASPADAGQLAAESRLLGLVRRALRDNDFAAALAWADEHARSYPHGSLSEERLILEAVAACRGDQRERGLAAAEQLRKQFPNTSALAKVEQSCAGD